MAPDRGSRAIEDFLFGECEEEEDFGNFPGHQCQEFVEDIVSARIEEIVNHAVDEMLGHIESRGAIKDKVDAPAVLLKVFVHFDRCWIARAIVPDLVKKFI
jgi:hypothetical protein